MTEARFSLSISGPPAGQYERGPSLTIRGESAEELLDNAEAFFGRDVSEDLLGIFDLGRATSLVKGKLDAEEKQPRKRGSRGSGGGGSSVAGSECPECGEGQLVSRKRRDNTGSFIGCDNFPDCRYIHRGD